MIEKIKILKRSKISRKKFKKIVKYFAYDIEANKTAEFTNLNRKPINKYFKKLEKQY